MWMITYTYTYDDTRDTIITNLHPLAWFKECIETHNRDRELPGINSETERKRGWVVILWTMKIPPGATTKEAMEWAEEQVERKL